MLFVAVVEHFTASWPSYLALAFICFVGILLFAKVYLRIRSYFKISVNCWFCCKTTRVQYSQKNNWDCPHCEQYNGFTDDGDYNREIISQFKDNNVQYSRKTIEKVAQCANNGFCQSCNDNQLSKVEKLSAFEPTSENNFSEELRKFKDALEETYRLCYRCEKNLSKVLAEKKKLILGLQLSQNLIKHTQNRIKTFFKPSHTRPSTLTKIMKSCTNIFLFVFATANWMNVVGPLKLNKDHLHNLFGPIISSILFFSISHLAAFTKVILQYFSNISSIHLIEKTILFIETIFTILAYVVGIDLTGLVKYYSAVSMYIIPFGSMILAFASHFWEKFKITKNTYLLAIWSGYSFLLKGDLPEEYSVYKVLASLVILVFSLPTFNMKNELQDILENSVNSFHRIRSDEYLPDQSKTLVHSSKSSNKSLNISNSSSLSSNTSLSLLSPGLRSFKKTLTSSALNLCATPARSFRNYSSEHLLREKQSPTLTSPSRFNPAANKLSPRSLNNSCSHTPLQPLHIDPNLNTSFGSSTPRSFISCAAASVRSTRSLLSPSHFSPVSTNIYYTAYEKPLQSPCLSNVGYPKSNDTMEKRKNYFLNNVVPHENISRGSSQSSGFESLGGSTLQAASERFYSFDSSFDHNYDQNSIYLEPPQTPNFHNASSPQPFEMPLVTHSAPATKPNIFQSKIMDFESGDHWVRNSPMEFERQSFKADYLANQSMNSTNSNAFDLNTMNSYLPYVRKRYNLLKNINANQHGEM